ncbi:MAG: DNA-methyltransferase [Candidatus Hodarchaeales archaeon]|jgi:site-specific DNA-methyltransferase (adenine-specific)
MNSEFELIKRQKVFYKSSESMEEIEDNSIDVIITSPPYNRGKEYTDDSKGSYNDKQELKDYCYLLQSVWNECYRVLKDTGIFFLNIGDAASDQGKSERVVQTAVDTGFIRIQTVVWVKSFLGRGHYTPTGGNKRLNNLWENVFLLAKNKKNYKIYPKEIGIPYADKSNIGRYSDEDLRDPGNVWLIPYSKTTGATIKKGHDAPFPIGLPIKCIKLTKANTVLDPFLGSGSTLAAAEAMGINGFGYEKYPRKELIKDTINSATLIEDNEILIPHLDLTIDALSSLIGHKNNNSDLSQYFKNTKKQKKNLELIKSVLDKKDISIEIINELLSLYEDPEKKNLKKSQFLEKFFKNKEE